MNNLYYPGHDRDWINAREQAKARDCYQCQICFRTDKLVVHHKIPETIGGSMELDNLVTLCVKCHRPIERMLYSKVIRTRAGLTEQEYFKRLNELGIFCTVEKEVKKAE